VKRISLICFFSGIALLTTILFFVGVIRANQQSLRKLDRRVKSFVVRDGLADVRGQIHVHCYRSHDSRGSLPAIAKAAKSAGINWIIFTDHVSSPKFADLLDPVNLEDVLLMFGKEEGITDGGSELSVNLRSSNGYLRILGHLEKERNLEMAEEEYWDGLEIVNLHANVVKQSWWKLLLGFNPYEKLCYKINSNFLYWQALSELRDRPVPITVAPDAHENIRILGLQLDPYDVIFRLVSTHLLLETEENSESVELTAEKVLAAIKKGRTYVAFDYLGDPTGFQFWAEKNKEKFFLGDTIVCPNRLVIKSPETIRTEIRIFRNNQLVAQKGWIRELVIENPELGFWRVEIYKNGQIWIISGQILVTNKE
jgi:hypothetical protein